MNADLDIQRELFHGGLYMTESLEEVRGIGDVT